DNDSMLIRFSNLSRRDFNSILEKVRKLGNRRYDPTLEGWVVPMTKSNFDEVDKLAREEGFLIDGAVLDRLDQLLIAESLSSSLYKPQSANEFSNISDLIGVLRDYQLVCVEYVSRNPRTIIGDDIGIGKTLEALASVINLNALPCVIITPARQLKLNWKHEITKWFGDKYRVMVLNGLEPTITPELVSSDFIIVNYEILASGSDPSLGQLPAIKIVRPKSIVCDECHKLKNRSSLRTRAVIELVNQCSPNVRLLLSGTPLLNRPQELVPLLDILGMLKPLFSSAGKFLIDYNWTNKDEVTGHRARKFSELNSILRQHCFIRRRKEDVLTELPSCTVAKQLIDLDNRNEYQSVQRDLVNWLIRKVLEDQNYMNSISHLPEPQRRKAIVDAGRNRAATALRAEQLTRIEFLKQVAVKGKLSGAIEWINNFLESDEKLVIFAYHNFALERLINKFNALHILAKDSEKSRMAAKYDFQTRSDKKLIICSMEVAELGIDLTAASHVAILELPWTPSKLDQAIGRVYRQGQAKPVTAWMLLSEGTIEDKILELLSKKKLVVDAVADGTYEEDTSGSNSILDDLVKFLSGGTV
ncbi:MAG: DEAD/DEAH box helicase, partial [Nitrososphaerota archaeon]